ncbi:MAG: hypothetical protein WB757_16000, partial [Candidatus Cybelea sp.]
MRLLARLIAVALILVAVAVIIFAGNVMIGMRAHSRVTGAISGLPVRESLSILRDDRGVPHVI